jgi:hypothetical protein
MVSDKHIERRGENKVDGSKPRNLRTEHVLVGPFLTGSVNLSKF